MVLVVSKSEHPVVNGESICHNCWDLVLNVSGTGTLTTGKQTYPFELGTIFCVPPNQTICKDSEEGYTDIHIYATTFLDSCDTTRLIVMQDDSLHTMEQFFTQMNQLFTHWTIFRGQIIEELYHVIQNYFSLRLQIQDAPKLVQEITETIVSNFADPSFNVNELLSSYNYCAEYIRRLFKKYHGRPPVEYITELRLEHAKRMLQVNQFHTYTIAQIALESGFNDPNYFSRVFKKYTHITPLQYAKQISKI